MVETLAVLPVKRLRQPIAPLRFDLGCKRGRVIAVEKYADARVGAAFIRVDSHKGDARSGLVQPQHDFAHLGILLNDLYGAGKWRREIGRASCRERGCQYV